MGPLKRVDIVHQPFCIDCRFFASEDAANSALKPGVEDDCLEGECRRHPPVLGIMLVDRHGDEFRHFGEWPKVLASDWYGDYAPARSGTRLHCDCHKQHAGTTAKTA